MSGLIVFCVFINTQLGCVWLRTVSRWKVKIWSMTSSDSSWPWRWWDSCRPPENSELQPENLTELMITPQRSLKLLWEDTGHAVNHFMCSDVWLADVALEGGVVMMYFSDMFSLFSLLWDLTPVLFSTESFLYCQRFFSWEISVTRRRRTETTPSISATQRCFLSSLSCWRWDDTERKPQNLCKSFTTHLTTATYM